jgi:hypothetical protein
MTNADGANRSGLDDPRISAALMIATYVASGLGYFLGILRWSSDGASDAILPVGLLAVGVVGVVSMIRHSVFHRSDAARMGWDLGHRNNFQIEVGFANFAVGATALAAVVLDWGTGVLAALTLVYALYFLQVSALVAIDRADGRLNVTRLTVMLLQTAFLGSFAVGALSQ